MYNFQDEPPISPIISY